MGVSFSNGLKDGGKNGAFQSTHANLVIPTEKKRKNLKQSQPKLK
jgi:hypothetical protein